MLPTYAPKNVDLSICIRELKKKSFVYIVIVTILIQSLPQEKAKVNYRTKKKGCLCGHPLCLVCPARVTARDLSSSEMTPTIHGK